MTPRHPQSTRYASSLLGLLRFLAKVSEGCFTVFFWMYLFSIFPLTDTFNQTLYHLAGGLGTIDRKTIALSAIGALASLVFFHVLSAWTAVYLEK